MTNNSLVTGSRPEEGQGWLHLRATEYALTGALAGLLFPILASIIKMAELGLSLSPTSAIRVQLGEPLLWITDTAPFFLGLLAGFAGRRQDLVVQANKELLNREAELNSVRADLENGILERTSALDKRNSQMRSVVAFARQVADIQDIESLLQASVAMIAEHFESLDADLFLMDDKGQWVILRASSSTAGNKLLREGFRIAVGDPSLIGRVAKRGKLLLSPMRTSSREQDARLSTTTGPATMIALPLLVRGKPIGVLDVHSKEIRPISQSESEVFQLLADQLAASIENARLATESRTTVQQLAALTSQGTRGSWQEYLKNREFSYQFTPAGVSSIPADGATHTAGGTRIPLSLRGEDIGSITLQRKEGGSWSRAEQELLQRIASQIALAVENARLLEQTRQRAAQEQIVGEISARFSRSLDVDTLLQSAVREFAALPDVTEAAVYLRPADEDLRQTKI